MLVPISGVFRIPWGGKFSLATSCLHKGAKLFFYFGKNQICWPKRGPWLNSPRNMPLASIAGLGIISIRVRMIGCWPAENWL